MAWWLWALGLATAASRTTNPILLALILTVAITVVMARRPAAPWALGLRTYLVLALVVVLVRMGFRLVLGADAGTTILFTLPQLQLPEAAAGIAIGGPVTAEGMLASFYDGLRLATLLLCVGAANLLADPKRLLTHLPAALYEVGATVIVALTIAPQMVQSVQRVRRARRLRGAESRGLRGLRSTLMPVLEDALDRSLSLAAAMDSRGYGRTAHIPVRTRRLASTMLLLGIGGMCVGVYGLLDGTTPRELGTPMMVLGVAAATVGLRLAGRRIARSVYRPDPWRGAEWSIAATGLVAAVATVTDGRIDPLLLFPSAQPLSWPALPLLAGIGVLVAILPARIAPPPVTPAGRPKRKEHPERPGSSTHPGSPERTGSPVRPAAPPARTTAPVAGFGS